MKDISRKQLARKIAFEIYSNPKEKNAVIKMLAGYIIEKKLSKQLGLLVNDIALEWQKLSSSTEATVRSRFPLDEPALRQIKSLIQTESDAKEVLIHQEKDESVIGGVIVQSPGFEVDMTIRKALNELTG